MKVKKLPPGEGAPEDADYIQIEHTKTGYMLTGCVAYDKSALYPLARFDSAEQAEREGVAWAESRDAEFLYVVTLDA